MAWQRKAAAQGSNTALRAFEMMYDRGRGVPQDTALSKLSLVGLRTTFTLTPPFQAQVPDESAVDERFVGVREGEHGETAVRLLVADDIESLPTGLRFNVSGKS